MGGFFKRGDIVTVGDNPRRWCVDQLRELPGPDGDPFQMADLSDEAGATTSKRTEVLTKVGG